MRRHFRHPQAMFNMGSLFYSHCGSYGKFEDFAGCLAPALEVAGGHTLPF
jgi:hypothetical protein